MVGAWAADLTMEPNGLACQPFGWLICLTVDTRKITVWCTGLGAMTPLGSDAPSTWTGMKAGKNGIRVLTEP
jgi:hypothetical protein